VVDRDFIIPLLTKPITVTACSARAASGHAAAPPSVAKNFRRWMWLAIGFIVAFEDSIRDGFELPMRQFVKERHRFQELNAI